MAAKQATQDTDRPRLTKSAVVGRALEMADQDGVDALTIRRLATELGDMAHFVTAAATP